MTLGKNAYYLLRRRIGMGDFHGFCGRQRVSAKHCKFIVGRTREYLTANEVEELMGTARKSSRYGHRDATMILIAYRHGLREAQPGPASFAGKSPKSL